MSAIGLEDKTVENADGTRTFFFEQKTCMPTYLVAIVVGELESRKVGPRSAVWSEPSMVDAGAHEFADTEKFLAIGEELLGDYVWGKYDVLLLPPSFPYGGMENPTLTFVTPTLLAGDRSLANVVAHEIAHSWCGNLVTNKYWNDFWLNEGLTVWTERKIMGRLLGDKVFHFQALNGLTALRDTVTLFKENDAMALTKLVPDLTGIDPDDAFSSVPYEKGFQFLWYLENLVGTPNFEPFMKAYIAKFAYKTVTTADFKETFLEHFAGNDAVKAIDWDAWTNTEGMPSNLAPHDETLSNQAHDLAAKWTATPAGEGTSASDMDGWRSGQVVMMLDDVTEQAAPLDHAVLAKMDETYSLTASRNSEIRFAWHILCLKSKYEKIFDQVIAFATEQGRMKFTRPLFRELAKSSDAGKKLAHDVFAKHRAAYHPITAKMVAKDLGIN